MKNSSNIMFKIGQILNIIAIPLCAIVFILGSILAGAGILGMAGVIDMRGEEAAIAALYGFIFLPYGVFLLVFSIISLVVCSKKHKAIVNGNDAAGPRVALIVLGALGNNIFYILAGIFSLVARSQEENK